MTALPAQEPSGWDEDLAWLDRDPMTAAEREAWLDRLCQLDDDPSTPRRSTGIRSRARRRPGRMS